MAKKQNYFESRTFTDVILEGSKAEPRRKIFGSFLYENTNTYFFSKTNLGKSLMCNQIAIQAATGITLDQGETLINETEPMKVLDVDLENSLQDIHSRNSLAAANLDSRLLDNLIFLHENPVVRPEFGFALLSRIEEEVYKNKVKLVVIDNISRILPDLLKADDVAKVIEFIKRIRQNSGASFLIVGHTTKTDNRTAINAQSYYGSSALQNFFPEIFWMDETRDGNFFLAHAKTKQAECYIDTVPVFSRGEHPQVGIGFNLQYLRPLSEIQLPFALGHSKPSRRTNLSKFKNEVNILDEAGVKRSTIAEMCDVARSTVYRLLDKRA